MLDCFEIITTSGVVLWSRSNIPIGPNVVNTLINDVFIEEKARPIVGGGDGSSMRHPAYKVDKYTLKYTLVKDLGLIFVVCNLLSFCKASSHTITGCISISATSYLDRQALGSHSNHICQAIPRSTERTEFDRYGLQVRRLL